MLHFLSIGSWGRGQIIILFYVTWQHECIRKLISKPYNITAKKLAFLAKFRKCQEVVAQFTVAEPSRKHKEISIFRIQTRYNANLLVSVGAPRRKVLRVDDIFRRQINDTSIKDHLYLCNTSKVTLLTHV